MPDLPASPPPPGTDTLGEVADLLSRLVRIPSVNPRDTPRPAEREAAGFVARWLEAAGLEVRQQDMGGGRPSVLARLAGEDRGRTLLLESHLDTVEVDDMTVAPFDPKIEGGRLYGRGSCDAKASVTAFMLAVSRVAAGGQRPAVDVALATVADEEHHHGGIDHLLDGGLRAEAAVVGEPTRLRMVIAHKGGVRFRVIVHGRAAHSSQPWNGDNAIDRMAEVLDHIRLRIQPRLLERTHPLCGPPTLTVTQIEGGLGINVVPSTCTIAVDRRTVPGEEGEDVFRELAASLESVGPGRVEVPPADFISYPMETNAQTTIAAAMGPALDAAGLDPEAIGVTYGSDASVIGRAGIPVVVFGPGNIDDAHQPDESVDLAQVQRASEVIETLIRGYGR
jgi:acetylornithine deacetylase